MKHRVTLEEICGEATRYEHERLIAGSSADHKQLNASMTISVTGVASLWFNVKDTSRPAGYQIVMLTANIQEAIERYNIL